MRKDNNFGDLNLDNSTIDQKEEERYNSFPQIEQAEFIEAVCEILRFYKKYKEENNE